MLQPNDVLAGTWKYTVVDSIGDGATGEVWEVSSPQFTGRLALKLLTHRNPPQSWPEHFEREFNVLSRTRHKHVVRVLDKGTHKTGTRAYPFIVTELIPGKNLEVAMETRATPLDPDEAMELVRQCALGLEHAHTKGVVHRDVKPNNIIWHVEENRAVLIDFGVAKDIQDTRHTVAAGKVGSITYSSYHKWTKPKEASASDDVFSLGVVFYFLLTKKTPFEADTEPALMELVKQGKYVDVADLRTDVPHDIASIVRKMIGNGFTADYNNCRYLLSDVRRLKKYRHHYNAVHIVRDWATASIGDFQLVMNKIFGVLNSARRPQDLFIRLASSMGRTNSDLLDYTEATDPKKLEDARHQAATSVARTFGWLCSLATALGIDLTSAVWRKFPGTCPYCQEHHTTESVCSMRRKDALDMWLLQEVANDNVASMPQSLREWEVMFRKVYPSTKANDIEFFSRKLIEELGEVADYIGRPNRRMEALRETGVDFLAFELADIFGWLCQCSTAVRPADLSEEKSAIAGEFEERMRGEICSFCYNAICTCDPELETRPGRLGEYRFLAGLSSLP